METKIKINFIDITSLNNTFCNPRKVWKELCVSIENIYKNFKKSQIDPKELIELIESSETNNGVPDNASILTLIDAMKRYIEEYKIDDSNTLFLEFKRHSAIYLFAIGSNEKALEILKDILTVINYKIEGTKENLDINLVCVKDVVKLNQASIYFWLENFDEARMLIEEVITYYESTDDELYLIKMVNFISVSFSYLAWIYMRNKSHQDAEKAFLHSLKVLKMVKNHTLTKSSQGKDNQFINTKSKKIYIYDQLINFYSFIKQYENCKNPLFEILKIMDKDSFQYELDIGPQNHAYYYTTATLYTLKSESNKIDLTKALHFIINIMRIVYNNVDSFELIPPIFFKVILDITDSIRRNKKKGIFYYDINAKGMENDKEFNELKNNLDAEENSERIYIQERIDFISDYLDQLIATFDTEKTYSLNPSSGASGLMDSIVTLDKYKFYIKNKYFSTFNFITDIQERFNEKYTKESYTEIKFEVDEISSIKLCCDRVLLKYSNIIKDLVDCKHLEEKIILEGLNGFLIIENDDIILYSVYRFLARDGTHLLFQDTHITSHENEKNEKKDKKILESFKILSLKRYDPKFAPLYYRRFFFKINKDAKAFNFAIYFAMINTLYSLKIYYPCVTLLSIFLDEISSTNGDLYEQAKTSKKIMCYLNLYEFFLLIQVYILIVLKNYDRALYELLKISKPISEYSNLIHKILISLCYSHCHYFDIALYTLCEASQLIRPLLEANQDVDYNEQLKNKTIDNKEKEKKKSHEAYVTEMRMFNSTIQCLILGIFRFMKRMKDLFPNGKMCFRCKVEDPGITAVCLNCKRAIYCNRKCLKKNRKIHDIICNILIEKNIPIKVTFEQMQVYFQDYELQVTRMNEKKLKDMSYV